MPSRPGLPSTRVKTMNMPASGTRLISVLVPRRITLSPTSRALVRKLATSVPACGSVMQIARMQSPVTTRGRIRSLIEAGA